MAVNVMGHRMRQLTSKVVRRARRLADNLAQPSEIERLMAALPRTEASGSVAGRTVLVTGSTRGVGRTIAETLAEDGAQVIVHGRRADGPDGSEAAARRLPGGDARWVAGDLSSPESAAKVLRDALGLGEVDMLIHNAAVAGPQSQAIWELTPDDLAALIHTNLEAVHAMSSALVRHWLEAGRTGRIVHVSTGAAEGAAPKLGGYSTSKAALEALARSYAEDLGRCGICVTTVRLGSVATDMTKRHFRWEDAARLPPPESVMPVIRHAVSAPADGVHGRTFTSWGMNADPVSGRFMAHPAAASPVFRYPSFELDGRPVRRDSGEVTIYDRAENQFGAAPEVKAALRDMLDRRPLTIYPDDDYNQLTDALARHHGMSRENFTVGAGSWDVLDRVLKLYCPRGGSVVTNSPGWFGFTMLLRQRGIQQVAVPFVAGTGGNRPHHNLDAVAAAVRHDTRAIYLINPSNPEGVSIDAEEFAGFLDAVPAHIPVIVDEAYAEFATSPGRLIGPKIVEGSDRPLIVTRTFSKFYGLAALRIGYGIASPEIVERLDRVALIFSVSKAAETAAVAALGATGRNEDLRSIVEAERRRITAELEGMGRRPIPSDSCFLLAPVPVPPDRYFDRFASENIHMPRAAFFDGEYVMFPVATEAQNDRNLAIYRSMT